MATDFGFAPTKGGKRYFISYNTEDKDRVGKIAKELYIMGLPIWYDYLLEPGEEWKKQIAENLQSCEAVIMFISSGIFVKKESYVRKEYDMAKFFDKKIYPVMLD